MWPGQHFNYVGNPTIIGDDPLTASMTLKAMAMTLSAFRVENFVALYCVILL